MAKHKFKNEYQGFYAAEMQAAKKDAQKFEQVTGVIFTIDNARRALLDTANSAMFYFHNDCENPNCDKFKNQFHKILRALPKKTLSDICGLVKTETLAHLRLSYGNFAVAWLADEI